MRTAKLIGNLNSYDVKLIDSETGANLLADIGVSELAIRYNEQGRCVLALTVDVEELDIEGPVRFYANYPGSHEMRELSELVFRDGSRWVAPTESDKDAEGV